MIYLHIAAAVLASWRITELFTQDRITDKIRKRFPTYLWQCPRCMSVWAGAWVTLVFAVGLRWPLVMWLNWPMALAWGYLSHIDWVISGRVAKQGRRLNVEIKDGQYKINSDLSRPEIHQVLSQLANQFQNGEAKTQ